MPNSKNQYDAIVIGSGISGGWAAKELCEKGLKTLVLERGKDVVHLKIIQQLPNNHGNFRIEKVKPWQCKKTTQCWIGVMRTTKPPSIFL